MNPIPRVKSARRCNGEAHCRWLEQQKWTTTEERDEDITFILMTCEHRRRIHQLRQERLFSQAVSRWHLKARSTLLKVEIRQTGIRRRLVIFVCAAWLPHEQAQLLIRCTDSFLRGVYM